MKLLLDSGADPNSIEDIAHIKGVTPLHMAAEMGHLEIAELLTQRGAKLDARTSTDSQHIHQAAINKHDEVALLLELGADVNCRDDNGVTPLDFAIFRENYQTADMIREVGGKHNKLKIKKDPETRERAEWSIADDITAKQDNAIVLVRVATAFATR